MATVRIHEIALVREPAPPPAPRVRVHEVFLTRTPAPAPGATVHVHGMWLTRGTDPPVHPGGIFAPRDGQWVEALEIRGVVDGQWA